MSHLQDCTLGETLYEGADTIVCRAKHKSSGDSLVVKISVPGVATQRAVGRLVHEQRILGMLGHVPGVVRLVHFEFDGTQAALLFEDQGLRSLDRLLVDCGHFSLVDVLRMGLETSRVLEGIHAAGIVHKDLKPQNMLWDEKSRRITLLDFAIASELAEEATTVAIPEALEGTLAYMSPEQTGRMAQGVDARTDLYSLGVVLFELVCGHRPFVETDPLALVHAHLAKPVPALEQLVANVPPVVARIVEHCLEKHPEKRYQTARGLAADLAVCVEQLEARGSIEEFALGTKDFSRVLHLPQMLVSREKEAAEIKEAFERAARSTVELLLLGGPSGVGKTALVRSVYEEIAKAGRGLLLSGKYDQLGGSIPYAALARAFGGLLRDIAASPKSVFDMWRERLGRALGPLVRIIADVVPELEWIMGEIPPMPVVPPEMAYNRLKLSWIEFVRVVADASPPLVLFLDDMQWVDPASLEILKTVLTDVARKNLLVIAAYRDNEVGQAHPLWNLVNAAENAGVGVPRMLVGPLDVQAVGAWLSVVLSAEKASVAPLARTLHAKTNGNPFFLGQLVLELYRQKCVQRDAETGVWQWNRDAVTRAAITDNVVELMQQRVVELPLDAQMLLGQAACVGHTFSLSELAVLSGRTASSLPLDLHAALVAGLVVPVDGQYREARAWTTEGVDIDASYRFLHDRVQQAFYERIDLARRAQAHLTIGRRLREAFEAEGKSNQKLLELVQHLNLGAAHLTTKAERQDLARLDLRAAKAAKANGSYRLQAKLVEQAQALLGETAWQDEPETSIELALERIEADYMLREFAEVHRRAQELLSRPLPKIARLTAQGLRVQCCQVSAQFAEGERIGLEALGEHGGFFPESDEACTMQCFALLMECQEWLDEHPDGFAHMPLEPSIEQYLLDVIEASVGICVAFGNRPTLAGIVNTRNVLRTLERGTLTAASPYFISCNASLRSVILGKYREDVAWLRVGLEAARRLESPYLAECMYLDAFYTPHYAPPARFRDSFVAVAQTAMAAGSFQGTSWGLMGEVYCIDFWTGRSLALVAQQIESRRERILRYGDTLGQHGIDVIACVVELLCSPKNARPPEGKPWLSVDSGQFAALGDNYIAELARIEETHLYLAFGEWKRASLWAEKAELHRPDAFAACPVAEIPLWRGLAAAKLFSPALEKSRCAELLERIEFGVARLRYFAEGCPENFLHKLRLIEAELARVLGQKDEAAAKYDEAIELARKEGFLQIEGLAAQFCAQFYQEQGRQRIAMLYVKDAIDAYRRWDALALVAHLEQRYPEALETAAFSGRAPRQTVTVGTSTTETSSGTALDVHTVIRAAQTLASELEPDRVVGRLMELCLANAGAERGALVLVKQDAAMLVARMSVRDMRIETGLSLPMAESQDVAQAVIDYVTRSRAPVVVQDVAKEKRFSEDSYFTSNKVRSLLAMPMNHAGKLVGVLYLEHGTIPSAFPESRVEMVSVLASQAAIAVENAKLVHNIEAQVRALEARNREVQELNDELRRQIAQRSRRLMDTLLPNGQIVATSHTFVPNDVMGDCYRVIRAIGEGAMGSVYEVERMTDGKHLAAKMLNHNPDRDDLARFVREAQILASLSHPNLISIYDVDVMDSGGLYIVMELVNGTNLRQIKGRQGDVPWVLGVLQQISRALGALHASSIVHRDLKPENILVVHHEGDRVPFIKLADFGISIMNDETHLSPKDRAAAETITADASQRRALVERGPMLTQTGVLVGTPLYMAPELGYGSRNAQSSSDIFSFGVIAFELLMGDRPYLVPPVLGGLIFDDVAERLRSCGGLSDDLVGLFAHCLDVDPEKRPTAEMVMKVLCRD